MGRIFHNYSFCRPADIHQKCFTDYLEPESFLNVISLLTTVLKPLVAISIMPYINGYCLPKPQGYVPVVICNDCYPRYACKDFQFCGPFFRNVIGGKYLTLLKPEGLGKHHQTLYSCGWGLGMRLSSSPLQFSLNHQPSSYFYF